MFVHKVSCNLVGGLTKLRLSFQSNPQGQGEDDPRQLFAAPVVGLIAKNSPCCTASRPTMRCSTGKPPFLAAPSSSAARTMSRSNKEKSQ
ncbi:hypothetical protein E2562_002162 [Oryza meyeriana var. granulata]|uniref:Uncharacterized protein n=1 Tax=Oryza meyeriana var. granulata TaxID=110450 RepID=A0A6G1EET0_9ORYZ|nr:hypothetical protein E2562_002162 [Oryza meyeriana var. granulata]